MKNPDKMNWWQEFNVACAARGLHHSDYDRFDVVNEWFERHPWLPEVAAQKLADEMKNASVGRHLDGYDWAAMNERSAAKPKRVRPD